MLGYFAKNGGFVVRCPGGAALKFPRVRGHGPELLALTHLQLGSRRSSRKPSPHALGFVVYRTTDGLVVYDGNVRGEEIGLQRLIASEPVTVEFSFRAHLTRGHYHLECHVVHNPTSRILSRLRPAGALTVGESRTWAGVADLEIACTIVT